MIYNWSPLHCDMKFFPPLWLHQYLKTRRGMTASCWVIQSLAGILDIAAIIRKEGTTFHWNPTICEIIFDLHCAAVKQSIFPAPPLAAWLPLLPPGCSAENPSYSLHSMLSWLHCVKTSHGPLKQQTCRKMLQQCFTTSALDWLQKEAHILFV